MNGIASAARFKQYVTRAFMVLLLICGFVAESRAVTRFGTGTGEKRIPAVGRFDDVWFYNREKSKVIPEINPHWIAVVFKSPVDAGGSSLPEKAKTILTRHSEFVDLFYDNNLAEDACFFKLREGVKTDALQSLLRKLNGEITVDYAHPALTIRDRTYTYFNVLEMKWKTGAEKGYRESLLKQARVSYDEKENVYRVNIHEIPFFKALNFLAEDITVLEATPYLVELKPSIRASLVLSLHGGNIGDTIPFLLSVEFSDRVSLDPSSFANIDLRPETIQKELFELQFDPYDYVKASSTSPIRITGWMRFYAPGEFVIPAMKVKYTCSSCSGGEVRSFETDPVHFKVASIIPSQQRGNTLIVPADTLIPDYHLGDYLKKGNVNIVISLISFLLGLGCIVWVVLNIRALRIQRARAGKKKMEDILLEKVRLLLCSQPSGPHWVYLGEVGSALREYIVAKYHIAQDPHGGSGEVFFDTIRHTIPGARWGRIHAVLKEVDNSIALELERYPGLEHLQAEIREIIDAL